MDQWQGRVAVITGANSGIGLGITKKLLDIGLTVVAIDKNSEELQCLVAEETKRVARLHPLHADICHDEEVTRAFQWIEQNLGGVDILINNAGLGGKESLLDGSPLEWRRLLDVNVVALCLCTKEAVASMQKRKIHDGHIINMSSNVSQFVPTFDKLHFYSATKHAVQALTEGFRQELRNIGSSIKITSICPGLVKTGIFKVSLGENVEKHIYKNNPFMEPNDIASAVEYIISTPPHVQVFNLSIKPTRSEN